MTRARTELAVAVAMALIFSALLAIWQNQRNVRAPDAAVALGDAIVVTEAPAAAPTPLAPTVENTTVLAGPLPGTAHEPPAPELESAQLESDRAYIAEAFPALSTWNVTELKPLLATEALNASTDADLEQVLATLSERLGELQYFDEPQPVEGTATIDAETQAELQPYRFTAWYEAGAAEVNLVLERQTQRSVHSFDIHIPN
ncbi:MAG: hypothetical protein ACO1PZ_10255 [Gammaproteobacteria bacterium]